MKPEHDRVMACAETRLRTEVTANGYALVADEPVRMGGTEAEPTPYDNLLAALGACTAITVRMYADRKQWPLESVTVRLTHRKIHAKDCEDCESRNGKLDRIERQLELAGSLDDKQLNPPAHFSLRSVL